VAFLKFAMEPAQAYSASGRCCVGACVTAAENAMTSGHGPFNLPSLGGRGIAAAAASVLLFSLAAMAQPSQVPAQAAPAVPGTSRAAEPGLIQSIGRWFEDSFARLKAGVQGTSGTLGDLGDRAGGAAKGAAAAAKDAAKDAAKGAAEAAKGAADALARLPGARIVDGRERCAVAPNGAPDCRTAAETVCRGKGFGSGTSLDIQSAQKCPARIWLSGRTPDPTECDVESFVTRAVCQ